MTKPELRALVAESIATSYVFASDPSARIIGLEPQELQSRAVAKIQVDDNFKIALTGACDQIMKMAESYADSRIGELLQDGTRTLNASGKLIEVEVAEPKLRVTNILNGAALDVSDGAFVVFIDSRSASTEALKKWEALTNGDNALMLIPLQVPNGQTVEQCVAAKRQEDAGFAG